MPLIHIFSKNRLNILQQNINHMEKDYFAFISYQRKDEQWAEWLLHQLEHYHLPSNVITKYPELPKELRPLFLDKNEL